MISYPILALYCLCIIVSSLAGGQVPMLVKLTHQRVQLASSVIGGFMLGVALLHLLPDAMEAAGDTAAVHWMMAGLLVMFLLERFFHFHHHEVAETERDLEAGHDETCEPHDHHHDEHDHDHAHPHDHVHVHGQRISWAGAGVGLVLHSMIAGMALAASMSVDPTQRWAGLAVFLVIVLHKPLDSMTLLTLMTLAGWSRAARHTVNLLFALAVPAGALLFIVGVGGEAHDSAAVGAAVAFASGVFLCIALSDVLPELQFHSHDKIKLTIALLLGVALAWTITFFEEGAHHHGDHDDAPGSAQVEPDHDHDH